VFGNSDGARMTTRTQVLRHALALVEKLNGRKQSIALPSAA
jgi:hypothetical protein